MGLNSSTDTLRNQFLMALVNKITGYELKPKVRCILKDDYSINVIKSSTIHNILLPPEYHYIADYIKHTDTLNREMNELEFTSFMKNIEPLDLEANDMFLDYRNKMIKLQSYDERLAQILKDQGF